MDLDLAPEHVLLRDTVRDFMENEVAPIVDEHERDRRFPSDIVKRLGEMGWLGIPVQEADGDWQVVKIGLPPAGEEVTGTETRADEKPPTPGDPRSPTQRDIPYFP